MSGVYLILFAFLARVTFAHICNVCECQPNNFEVFSVTCDGKSKDHLQFTSSMMMGAESAVMVVIKNCQIVTVERNSFAQLRKLDTLVVQNCEKLYLAPGAFASLNSLLINTVHDISFGEMALMGARGIKNIIINSSNITLLSQHSLFDIEGMEKFSLNAVNIGIIHKNAVNVNAKKISVENTKVNYTETNGVVLVAEQLLIKQSEFQLTEPFAASIVSDFQIRLLQNNFTNIVHFNISSPFVEFYANRIQYFSADILADIQSTQIVGNSIYDGDLQFIKSIDHKDFHDNEVNCKCRMNLMQTMRNVYNYDVLKRNYCIANCTLSIFDFETESAAPCMKTGYVNIENFCTYGRTLKKGFRSMNPTYAPNGDTSVTPIGLQPRFLITDPQVPDHNSAEGRYLAHTLFMAVFGLVVVLNY